MNQVLLLYIRVAQCELEGREGMTMDANAIGQEHACRTWEHKLLPSYAG